MNKRGASIDNFFVMIQYFGLAIFFIVLLLFWAGVSDLNTELWSASSVGQEIKSNAQDTVNLFDFISMLVYFGIHIGIIALAFLLRTHPIIYLVAIILIALLAIVGVELSNSYEQIISDPDIATVASDIPMTNYIMSNLPMFEVIWGFVTAVVLFGIARYEGLV